MCYKTYALVLAAVFLWGAEVGAGEEKTAPAPQEKPVGAPANTVVFRVPSPTLVAPVGETLDISGQKTVKFSWKPAHTPYDVYCYLFRIYLENETSQNGAIYHEQVSGLHTEIEVPADLFRDGKTYTWCLKQVNSAQQLLFSDAVHHTFRVIKK
ncbi:hypothetical protein BU251_07015 [Candidatus Velamenicoccus archaeovorus]|uniref:Fibronectin type-III domain-containing protein n=1 Tax=Velamenicoccus archaeovorus TaxID=1930593 RepID=A0A410P5Q1_VELA1|nr:hypothetical protein [Candidatus Velamenicoccus archaeovorus]QAT17480.1 hypothetical protein BU251_07015 [Candidatus Velamenicoccus archaeovorus]